ncbi:MAG TPA: 50S ribosomal protein L34e [Candidatus Nanoarchaeia archaeon]|nr:50S ribosomal protein L34e [Candidatus Nanoarchaeia archaeon]
MVSPRFRSRTFRRVHVTTPGGNRVIHYRRRKPSKAECGGCHKPLSGVPRETAKVMQNLPKTHKRPQRPFGGVLCSACTRRTIIAKSRS